jgi:hypothetical protein
VQIIVLLVMVCSEARLTQVECFFNALNGTVVHGATVRQSWLRLSSKRIASQQNDIASAQRKLNCDTRYNSVFHAKGILLLMAPSNKPYYTTHTWMVFKEWATTCKGLLDLQRLNVVVPLSKPPLTSVPPTRQYPFLMSARRIRSSVLEDVDIDRHASLFQPAFTAPTKHTFFTPHACPQCHRPQLLTLYPQRACVFCHDGVQDHQYVSRIEPIKMEQYIDLTYR